MEKKINKKTKFKKKYQFTEKSVLTPLTSNPGAGTFDRDVFRTSVPSLVGMLDYATMDIACP
jgi:hypothetical protein